VTNGDFGTGMLPPWGTFGQIIYQIVGGVFEFYRPPGTPSGVVLQGTLQAMTANQIMTLRFALANSSGVRKRVTILLHDGDFLDLSACTFWLAPGQVFDGYTMRTFATKAWTNATVSVYPATIGLDQWIRLDEVSLERTPATAILGTECVEPGGDPEPPPETLRRRVVRSTGVIPARPSSASAAPTTRRLTPAVRSTAVPEVAHTGAGARGASSARLSPATAAAGALVSPAWVSWDLAGPLDLTTATHARLRLRSWRAGTVAGTAVIQVSSNDADWVTVYAVPAVDAWLPVEVDLTSFTGATLSVRGVVDHGAGDRYVTDVWLIDDVTVETSE